VNKVTCILYRRKPRNVREYAVEENKKSNLKKSFCRLASFWRSILYFSAKNSTHIDVNAKVSVWLIELLSYMHKVCGMNRMMRV
jgi:hypothetical protein